MSRHDISVVGHASYRRELCRVITPVLESYSMNTHAPAYNTQLESLTVWVAQVPH